MLFPIFSAIDDILGPLLIIRKLNSGSVVFEKEYHMLVNQGAISKRDIRYVLLALFDASVIGNQPSMKGQSIYRFFQKTPQFNFNETVIIVETIIKPCRYFEIVYIRPLSLGGKGAVNVSKRNFNSGKVQ